MTAVQLPPVLRTTSEAGATSLRLEIDSTDVARGFGQVVLAVADLLRELLERQAIRRIDAGDLNDDQIERLGSSLLRIGEQIAELRTSLGSPGAQNVRRDHP
jgi:hypothetical protein